MFLDAATLKQTIIGKTSYVICYKKNNVIWDIDVKKLIIDTRIKFCIYVRHAFRLQKTNQ